MEVTEDVVEGAVGVEQCYLLVHIHVGLDSRVEASCSSTRRCSSMVWDVERLRGHGLDGHKAPPPTGRIMSGAKKTNT